MLEKNPEEGETCVTIIKQSYVTKFIQHVFQVNLYIEWNKNTGICLYTYILYVKTIKS